MTPHSKITRIEFYLPEQVLTNADLTGRFPEFQAQRSAAKLGIHTRHRAAPGETAVDMAEKAAEQLLRKMDRNTIDYLLLCTQSPDYFLPASSCILQDRLGLPQRIGALDFNHGCSGYLYGLSLAKGLIAGGMAERVLLLTSETYSRYLAADDLGNQTIFGDGAAATLVESSATAQIMDFVLGTDGSGYRNLIVSAGGARCPTDGDKAPFLFMDGAEIVNFALERVPRMVEETLERNGLQKEEIDHFVFHQATWYLLNVIRKELKIPEAKFHFDIGGIGNTVSSTLPIALKQLETAGRLRKNDKILLAGFGVGYSFGATVMVWD